MNREKYPEKVPFRLTRMLVKAMEISGIEGSYRSTCERTMTVLRDSRDSLVAMLEAFVYDPLISWRLVGLSEEGSSGRRGNEAAANLDVIERTTTGEASTRVLPDSIAEGLDEDIDDGTSMASTGGASLSERIHAGGVLEASRAQEAATSAVGRARSLQMYSEIQTMAANLDASSRIASVAAGDGAAAAVHQDSLAQSRIGRSLRQREVLSLLEGEAGQAHEEALNEKALKVIRRVQDKLSGTDFSDVAETGEPLDVSDQVQRLIVQATSSENLCQLFIGWCAFW
jgi:FKBP12-rapamycin complex-associated protein